MAGKKYLTSARTKKDSLKQKVFAGEGIKSDTSQKKFALVSEIELRCAENRSVATKTKSKLNLK